jgi:hypothetical protein
MMTQAEAQTALEVKALAEEIFLLKIEPSLTPDDIGRFVSIDVLSGEWEIDDHPDHGADRLMKRLGTRHQIWMLRHGHRSAFTILSPKQTEIEQ